MSIEIIMNWDEEKQDFDTRILKKCHECGRDICDDFFVEHYRRDEYYHIDCFKQDK